MKSTATDAAPIRFAAIGDYGLAGKNEQLVAELVRKWQPDLIITLGDNNYPRGSESTIDENIGQYYADYIYPYKGAFGSIAEKNRFFPSLGNHDLIADEGQPYLEYFTLPGNERYYKYSWEFIDFFALNSCEDPDGITLISTQAKWLKDALTASSATWKIVYFHHPSFSSGEHGSAEEMQWPFKEWGASIVLSGHDHTYERLMVDGFPYIVNGLGGKSKYPFLKILPGSQIRYNDAYGALFAETSKEKIRFKFVNVDGETSDQFEIIK